MAYKYPFSSTRAPGGVSPTTLLSLINALKPQLVGLTDIVGNYSLSTGTIESRLVELKELASSSSDGTYQQLAMGIFDIKNGTVTGTTGYPNLDGNSDDFQTWDILSSTTDDGEIHVAYAGHLNSTQTAVSEIFIPILGTGNYAIKVYVEGTTNPVFDSGVLAAPATRTVVTITNLLEQPILEGRYFVTVEAFIDANENVKVGLPFTTQTSTLP